LGSNVSSAQDRALLPSRSIKPLREDLNSQLLPSLRTS